MDAAREVHGKEGPQAAARASEEARIAWVTAQLVDAGRARAESLGWTDVYTLTKAFAERAAETLWADNGHRLSVVRPAIIESAVQHPFPGWIDGFKVADPLILAYGRGLLPEFPGLPDSVLDLIPVDHVVNAILAVAANPAPAGEPQYFQVASGASNPLPFHEMFENVNEYFTQNPMPQPGKGHIRVPTWEFPGGRVVERKLANKAKLADRYEKFLHRMPSSKRNRRALAKLQTQRADLETLRNFTELYRAYVQTEIIFDDTNTRALHASLPAELQADRGFDITAVDWRDYLQKVHFPAITEMTRAFSKRPESGRRAQAPARPAAADGCRGRLRHGGHGRRLQHRAAVPLGALGGVPEGGLAGRGAQHPRQPAALPACRAPGPRRVHPHLPPSLRGDAGRPPREDRRPRLRRHDVAAHERRGGRSASASIAPPGTARCWSAVRSRASRSRSPTCSTRSSPARCTRRTACSPATSRAPRSSTRPGPPG